MRAVVLFFSFFGSSDSYFGLFVLKTVFHYYIYTGMLLTSNDISVAKESLVQFCATRSVATPRCFMQPWEWSVWTAATSLCQTKAGRQEYSQRTRWLSAHAPHRCTSAALVAVCCRRHVHDTVTHSAWLCMGRSELFPLSGRA